MSEPPGNVDATSLRDEFLECPVCVDYYNHTNRRPRLLKYCLHALCTECIDKLLQKEGRGQLTCPLCRHVEKVKGKAALLPADPVRSKLVDFLHMKQQKKIKCLDCPDGNDADGRCDECQSYLCKECISAHRRNRLSRDHRIKSIEDSLKVPIKEFSQGHFCPKHPKQHIEFYCVTDEELCCVSCTVVDHSGHKFEKIQDAAEERISSLNKSLKDLNKAKIDLQQHQKATKAKKNAVQKMEKDSERNINRMIDDKKLQLDQRRNQLLSELKQESSAMLSAIEKSLEAYETTLAIIESTITYFNQTKEKADDVEMMQMYPDIKRSVVALQSQPVAADVRINEDMLQFSPTQKTAFDDLLTQLGSFGAVHHIPAAPRRLTVSKQAGCTVAQGKTLTVKIYKGDLTTLTTDVIVRLVTPDLSSLDGVSESVAAAAGPSVTRQLQRVVREKGEASLGSVVVTGAGRLPCKNIFNIVMQYSLDDIKAASIRCLCEAANRKLKSIAFLYIFADPILAIRSFDESVTGGSLQEVHLVAADYQELSHGEEEMKKIWTQVSRVEQKDIDVMGGHLRPSSGAMLLYLY